MSKQVTITLYLFILFFFFACVKPIGTHAAIDACAEDEWCSRTTSEGTCDYLGGRWVGINNCTRLQDASGDCCRPREGQGPILFGELEEAALPRFVGQAVLVDAYILRALPVIYSAAGILLLVYLLLGGYGYLVSQGDPKAIATARSKITHALIGLVIVFLSYWVVHVVGLLLGSEKVGLIFPGLNYYQNP